MGSPIFLLGCSSAGVGYQAKEESGVTVPSPEHLGPPKSLRILEVTAAPGSPAPAGPAGPRVRSAPTGRQDLEQAGTSLPEELFPRGTAWGQVCGAGLERWELPEGNLLCPGRRWRGGGGGFTSSALSLPSQSACGNRTMKIVGGSPAPERRWPWQVSLRIGYSHFCGGSLITSRWVLSAAHCILRYADYMVQLGDRMLDGSSEQALMVPVQKIIIHKDFEAASLTHDLALLRLAYSVNFSSYIQPVCLPGKSLTVKAGMLCWVTGWGQLSENGSSQMAVELQESQLRIIHFNQCNGMLQNKLSTSTNLVKMGSICGYSAQGKDACQGDSGGPLVCEYNETWIQVGVVSWGIGCGRQGYPGVYTEVGYHRDWIFRHLSLATCLDSATFLILSLCLVLSLHILGTS
uniref:Peptidase S1 domain-containing protein n=1 Tax=Oryctolagus cuniculus TaxID=9986 RepID=G1TRA2_RABIT